ncbi:hypothetical protein ACFQT0_17765 [Hymenobacter humi]|uniref:Uncharacterized protein n=1 Tax=Hymenobacter humi TaxID=1411620 RepID=A0ABW2U934_9BACT
MLAKLVEEAQELMAALPEELLTELTDMLEVFDRILAAGEISWLQVRQL